LEKGGKKERGKQACRRKEQNADLLKNRVENRQRRKEIRENV